MTASLQQFLTELYELDPTLRSEEQQLLPIIEQLMKSDPAQAPTKEFIVRLRGELKEHAASLTSQPSQKSHRTLWSIVAGAAVTAVILPVLFFSWKQDSFQSPIAISDNSVEQSDMKTFGTRAGNAPQTVGRGGGNGYSMSETDQNMMIYPMTRYSYVYEGDLEGISSSVDVYRRSVRRAKIPMADLAKSFNLRTVQMDTFSEMNVDSVTFTQDIPFGYQLFVNIRESTVGIDAQWDRWPQSTCTTDACFQKERLKPEQIPTNDLLIGIAQNFATVHGIDLSQYGDPVVDTNWKRDYERAADASMAYIPDVLNVVFPFLIDGKTVHDQTGMPSGISMGVNVRQKKVSNVWGMMDRSYEKSTFAGLSGPEDVMSYLKNMNRYPSMPDANQQEVKLILGTPIIGYAMFYRYDTGMSEELLVPSLIFPITEAKGETTEWYAPYVVVPLAKDFLNLSIDGPGIMPMTEPAMDVKSFE